MASRSMEDLVNSTCPRRLLAIIATTVVAAIVNPATATATTHGIDIDGGEMLLSKTGVSQVIDFEPKAYCTSPTLTLDDGTGTTASVTALSSSHVQSYPIGSLLTVMTRSTSGNTSGTLTSTSTPHTITSMRVAVVMTIYNTSGCTPTGTPLCTLAALLGLDGTSSSTSGGNDFSFTGSSVGTVVAFPTCTAGPSSLTGTSVTVMWPIMGAIAPQATFDSDVTGGTITLTGTGGATSQLPLAGSGDGCGTTMRWSVSHDAQRGHIGQLTGKAHLVYSGTHYVAVINRRHSQRGPISTTTTSGTIGPLALAIDIDLFEATDQTSTADDCTSYDSALEARISAAVNLTGTYTHSTTTSSLDSSSETSTQSTAVFHYSFFVSTPFTPFTVGTTTVTGLTDHVEPT